MSIKNHPAQFLQQTDIYLPQKISDSNRLDAQVAYFVTEKMVFIGKSQKFSIRSDFYQQTRNWKSSKCFAVLRQ
jgi:hypothetical protein